VTRPVVTALVAGVLAWTACGPPGPRAIRYGEDLCEGCHMTITDPAFAGQLVSVTGKVFVFDDIGELAAFAARTPIDQVHGVWVHRFLEPQDRLRAEDAVFLHSDRLRSPMASGLAAFRDRTVADSMRAVIGGELLDWAGVLAAVDALPEVVTRS